MPHEFEITRRVEFSETDMEGIMHFSNFFRFMETAEHAFLRSLGYSAVLSRKGLEVCLPRVHAECDYQAPLRFEDEVLIHLRVERKGSRSLTYGFRFYRLQGSAREAIARGKVTAVCASRQPDGSFKAVPLPKELDEKIQEAPGDESGSPAHNAELAGSDTHPAPQPVAQSPMAAGTKVRL